MNVAIVGYGYYVFGNENLLGGTVMPALVTWFRLNRPESFSVDILVRKKSENNARQRLLKYLELNSINNLFDIKIITDYKDKKYDAAIIAIPEISHREVINSLENVKQFMIVKPVGVNLEDFNSINETIKSRGQKGFVDFHKRFDPANILFNYQLKNSDTSDCFFTFSYGQKREMITKYFKKWYSSSNPFQYLAPHYIDIILWSCNVNVENMKIDTNINRPIFDDFGVPIFVSGSIEISDPKNLIRILFDCNWYESNFSPYSSRQRIEYFSKEKHIFSEQDNRGILLLNEEKVEIPNPHYRIETNNLSFGYGVDVYLNFFNSSFNQSFENPNMVKIQDYLGVAKIIDFVNKKINEYKN